MSFFSGKFRGQRRKVADGRMRKVSYGNPRGMGTRGGGGGAGKRWESHTTLLNAE